MRIAFCTPFKPLDNARPSGDVVIAQDLVLSLRELGHDVCVLEHFPAKWIYWKPWRWRPALKALSRMTEQARGADCVLTYNSYYKVPDVFGPAMCNTLALPYFLFSASYAPKRGKRMKTMAGYWLNRRAMLSAGHVFCNKEPYYRTAGWLLPPERFSRVRPGFRTNGFVRHAEARKQLRSEWNADERFVLCTAAMMRPGVKADGVRWVLRAAAVLAEHGVDALTVVAGGGSEMPQLRDEARAMGVDVLFTGQISRGRLAEIYSAADLFAFPGIEESIGMVYLEAQACGLPVVATDHEGAPQVVELGGSGIICAAEQDAFCHAVKELALDPQRRAAMARRAPLYVRENHALPGAYREMAGTMERIVAQAAERTAKGELR
jgi:glycosyltransferase involved in cell wall biosynthesis